MCDALHGSIKHDHNLQLKLDHNALPHNRDNIS